MPTRSAEPVAQLPYSSTFGRPTKPLDGIDTLAYATIELQSAAATPKSGTFRARTTDSSVKT
jgi:hypothetical protein